MKRTIEIFINDEWTISTMKNVKIGNMFRMFEPTEINDSRAGMQVGGEWIAESDAILTDGVWGVKVSEDRKNDSN